MTGLPFIFFDVVSYAAGLTALSFWRFAIATLASIMPASFLLAHFGNEMATGEASRIISPIEHRSGHIAYAIDTKDQTDAGCRNATANGVSARCLVDFDRRVETRNLAVWTRKFAGHIRTGRDPAAYWLFRRTEMSG